MAIKKINRRVILAKVETTEGTDAVPTGGANAILIGEPTITPMAGGTVERNLVKQFLGADPAIHVDTHVMVEFAVEIAGSGTVAVAPAYGPLLRGCGFAETITPTTGPVEYDPVSTGEESLSIYFNADGTRHALLGARGNVTLAFPPNDVPRFNFTFQGLWVAPAAQALPTPVFTAFKDPLPVSNVNTPTFTLHGYSGILESLEIDLGNTIVHRDRPGSKQVLLSDRRSTGSIPLQSPGLATKDFFAAAKAETLAALQLVHGTVANAIVQVDAPKVQLMEPTYAGADGVELLNMSLRLTPNAGDDEIKITVK